MFIVLLAVGLIVFVGAHLYPALPGAREAAVRRLGEQKYLGIYSVISLAGFSAAISGYVNAPYVHLYTAPAWGWHVTAATMVVSTLMLAALIVPSNIKRVIRHPMLWAFGFWGIGHLFANGGVASVLLFGVLGGWAVLGVYLLNMRHHPPYGEKQPLWRDGLMIAVWIALFAGLYFGHPYLFGVYPGPVVVDLPGDPA